MGYPSMRSAGAKFKKNKMATKNKTEKKKVKEKWSWKAQGKVRLNSDIPLALEPRFAALSGLTEKKERKASSEEVWKWMLDYDDLDKVLLEMKRAYLKKRGLI
jgi:hypothetical protein